MSMRFAVCVGLKERFDIRYIPEPMSGCWLWIGGIFRNGYGSIPVGTEVKAAHRVSWILHRGDIPTGLHVLHRCDVRSCVNPDHLFVGTNLDNMLDMVAKGRNRFGGGHGVRLTKTDVLALRRRYAAGEVGTKLAAEYGLRKVHVYQVVNRKIWRNIE